MSADRFADADSIESLIAQAIGAGSMCWEHVNNAGVFQSTEARGIADDAAARARELLATVRPDPGDKAQVELLEQIIERDHRWTDTPLPAFMVGDDVQAYIYRRDCLCGEQFEDGKAHRQHVYRAVLTALAAMGGDRS